jgi:hypothetical protein
MNNRQFEKLFFAPKKSLLWVYFSLPIKQMLPALRGIFCTSQILWLGGLPDAQRSVELLMSAREVSGYASAIGREIKVLLSMMGQGWLLLQNGKVQTSIEQMQTSSDRCGSSLMQQKEHHIWNHTDMC